MKKKRIIALMLAGFMTLSLTACGNSSSGESSKSSQEGISTTAPSTETVIDHSETYTVNVFTMGGNYVGEQTGWFAKIVKDKFNIVLNIDGTNGDNAKFATKMASGDLGDLVLFGDNTDQTQTAVEAGLLLDWNKEGLLDTYGADLKERFPEALEKNKEQFGNGTTVYGIGSEVGDTNEGPGEIGDFVWGPYLRWDLYAKIGYPQINSMEDYLDVLKKMQDLEPKTADGKPVYGFSFWKDWDGSHMMNAKQFACMNGFNDDTAGLVLVHASRDEYQDILQPDGYYLRALKMFFKANQMGLVDPESPSQNWDTIYSKMGNGQVLFSFFSWLRPYNTDENKKQGKGLMLVPFKGEEVYSYGMNIFGGRFATAIGAKAKHPERIMELLNWMSTDDGMMETFNGPEGLIWDYKDGKAVLTDFGIKVRGDASTIIPDEYGGGKFEDGNNKIGALIVNPQNINKKTGEPYNKEGWSSVINMNNTKLDTDWTAKMGAKTSVEWFQKNANIAIFKPTKQTVNINLNDDLKQILDQVGSVIKEYSWKMIFAKDEAQFNKLQEEMLTKAKGLGYDKVVDENIKMAKQFFEYRKEN
jgi:putative aldouronate transport system substrate-binding protein